jgi:hypothetical protein
MVMVARYEPEVIAFIAATYYRGSDEKVPTTALRTMSLHGVMLSSRYQKAEELEFMAAMVELLSSEIRSRIAAIWCDSKTARKFLVTLRDGFVEAAAEIGVWLAAASGTHNGIAIYDVKGVPICTFDANRLA